MNEPTEIKYSLDETGEPYYAATHIQAVKGIDFDSDENLVSIITSLQTEIYQLKEDLTLKDTTIKNLTTRITKAEQDIIELKPKEVN